LFKMFPLILLSLKQEEHFFLQKMRYIGNTPKVDLKGDYQL